MFNVETQYILTVGNLVLLGYAKQINAGDLKGV